MKSRGGGGSSPIGHRFTTGTSSASHVAHKEAEGDKRNDM